MLEKKLSQGGWWQPTWAVVLWRLAPKHLWRAPPDTQTVIWPHLWRFSNVWRWLIAREQPRRNGQSLEGLLRVRDIQTDMCGRPLLFDQEFILGSYYLTRLLQSGLRRSTSDLVDLPLWWKALVLASLQRAWCHKTPASGLFLDPVQCLTWLWCLFGAFLRILVSQFWKSTKYAFVFGACKVSKTELIALDFERGLLQVELKRPRQLPPWHTILNFRGAVLRC